MKRRVRPALPCVWLVIGAYLATGCGGTYDSSFQAGDAADGAISGPIANAGRDQTVEIGSLATLDGSASQGAQLRFEWTLISKPAGSKAELTAPREAVVRFLVDLRGSYALRLVVVSNGVSSAPSLVMVTGVEPRADAAAEGGRAEDATATPDAGSVLDAIDAARGDERSDAGPDPIVDAATEGAPGDDGPRDTTIDLVLVDGAAGEDTRDAEADGSGGGVRDTASDRTDNDVRDVRLEPDARDVGPDSTGAGGDATDAVVDATEAGTIDAGDAANDAADAGPLCGLPPFLTPLGNFRYANCGALDISDVVQGDAGTLYFFSTSLRRIVAWSAVSGVCSSPILLGISPNYVTYSRVNHRLYVAYASGAITSIDPDVPAEAPFASTPLPATGLAAAGGFILAADSTGPWATHYVFDPRGNQVASKDWNYYSRSYAFSEVTGRMYFFRDDTSPNDVHFEQIDCTTGAIVADGETPYHGAYDIAPPIRVSPDGKSVLIGAGEIYDGLSLRRIMSVPGVIKDAAWLPNGKLLVLREAGSATVIEQRGGSRLYLENLQAFDGAPLALRSIGDGAVVVTSVGGTPSFTVYHANDDGDGDGIPYAQDLFPLDKAASVDTDHDGFPDAWNTGQNGSGSSLTLDAFPLDSACHLTSQGQIGDPTHCDIIGTTPNYTPTSVLFDGTDILYLHSRTDNRIFRYSTVQSQHFNPIVPRADTSLVTYSSAHGKVYLAHDDGAISSIDVAGLAELEYVTLPKQPHGLAAVGNFVLAADASGAWATHYVFGIDAALLAEVEWNYYSREYAFSSATSRVYFFRDDSSPNDLHWEAIEPNTGNITAAGETPYHGTYSYQPPIRVSQDGGYVLLGTGDIYDGIQLNHQLALPVTPLDAAWLPNNGVVVLTADGVLRWFDNTFTPGATRAVTGTPLRIFWTSGKLIVITLVGGKPAFENITL